MLKIILLTYSILCVSIALLAVESRNPIDFDSIKTQIPLVERSNFESTEAFALSLTATAKNDIEKLAFTYFWITHTIDYAIERINSFRTYKSEEEVLDYIIKTNRGVCLHYCMYFEEFCEALDIPCYTVSGYVKQRGKIVQTPHTWNAVYINNSWTLMDATWGAGYVNEGTFTKKFNPSFFMVSPDRFIFTHYPFDRMWQFKEMPFNYDDFVQGEKITQSDRFNFSDTLQHFIGLSECDQLLDEYHRIKNYQPDIPVVSNELYYKAQNIKVCDHNLQAELINRGVAYYEKVVSQFNNYISLYNKQFKSPTLTDQEITNIIYEISANLSYARKSYQTVKITNKEIDSAVQQNIRSLNELEKQVNKEIDFIDLYINTQDNERVKLFYNRKFH